MCRSVVLETCLVTNPMKRFLLLCDRRIHDVVSIIAVCSNVRWFYADHESTTCPRSVARLHSATHPCDTLYTGQHRLEQSHLRMHLALGPCSHTASM